MGSLAVCAVHNTVSEASQFPFQFLDCYRLSWPLRQKTPAFGIVYFHCSQEKFLHLFFLYWKWLKKFLKSVLCHMHRLRCLKDRKLHVRESVRLLVGAAEHSFLDWSRRRRRIRRRKKCIKQKWCKVSANVLGGILKCWGPSRRKLSACKSVD